MIIALVFCGFWFIYECDCSLLAFGICFDLCFGVCGLWWYLLCSGFWCLGVVITVFEYSVLGFLCTWYFGCVFWVIYGVCLCLVCVLMA